MTERKFSKSLSKPGMAAHVRETVSQVVRSTSVQAKSKQVAPIDYEDFVMKNKTQIQNDPLRELLLFPSDDVSTVVLPRRYRTTTHNIPTASDTNDCSLLVKACLRSYSSNWNLIHYKFSAYSGSYLDLPKLAKNEELKEEVYEVDTDADQVEDTHLNRLDGITKEGFLLKGPDVTNDRIFVNIGSKSFKKRYCCLRQHVDGNYILEVHKDETKGEAKITVDMEFCEEVIKNSRRGRNCFELKMSGHKSFTFATESESDLLGWISTLQQVLHQNRAQEEKRCGSLERGGGGESCSSQQQQLYGTLKGLEQSVNPQLIKYGRETDASIALARKEHRKRLFTIYPHIPHVKSGSCEVTSEPPTEPYREQFGQRVLLQCQTVQFRLQVPTDNSTQVNQVEPYLCYLALFDAKNNKKLTENFHFDVNEDKAREMIASENDLPVTKYLSAELSQVAERWCLYPSQAVMSVSNAHADVFLVLRVDKVLQGPVSAVADPYIKCAKDPKLAARVHKTAKQFCQRLGKYRMPFAWAARPLFKNLSHELDTSPEFPAIYRQEPHRLRDDEILRILSEYRKPDKMSKLVTIPGWARIRLEAVTELPDNSLTTALVPLKPFPIPPTKPPTLEVAELEGSSPHPYTTFNNHLYVYPRSLVFDSQKNFSRARNLACVIELRDSDEEAAVPLYCMYGRAGEPLLTQRITCTVLHHNTVPLWNDEVKLRLPIHLRPKHHLLFTFYHVSCEINKKKDMGVETCVGYSWLPLLQKGRIVVEDQHLAVSTHLPPGYLNIQPFGLDKGNAPPEVTWVDNQRQIFSVGFELVSTVITRDQHLHNLFSHLDKLLDRAPGLAPPSESETCKILKASHAIHLNTCIAFLPTMLNELFKVLLVAQSLEVALNLVRVLIHLIHVIHNDGRESILHSYIKFVFCAPCVAGVKTTIHEELAGSVASLLATANTDFLIVEKFMQHSGFFFHIMAKSMAQHLLSSGRIKMHRNERFSGEYLSRVEKMLNVLAPYVVSKSDKSRALNTSIALFLNKCLSLMDRGYVFNLIATYVDHFTGSDAKTLSELKFAFLQIITSHEHYVAFNLPVQTVKMRPSRSNGDSPVAEFNLTEEFRKQHYLVGVLLQEVRGALDGEGGGVRRQALATLRDLLAKHELDDRYQSRGQLTRIATLYVPWLNVVLEQLPRLRAACGLTGSGARLSSTSSTSIMHRRVSASTPFQRSSQAPSVRASVCLKDSHLFAVIAGQGTLTNGTSDMSLESESSAGDGTSCVSQETAIIREVDADSGSALPKHARSVSGVTCVSAVPMEKYQLSEVKDMLLCFLFVVKYVGEETLIGWWQRSHPDVTTNFFTVIEICLHQFKYLGKKRIVGAGAGGKVGAGGKPGKSMTLPARMQPPDFDKVGGVTNSVGRDGQVAVPDSESANLYQALLEANMATEVGLLALDALGLYCLHLQDNLLARNGDNPLMAKLFDIYLSFLQVGQSETLFRHVFAALRAFINNFSVALFKGNASMCGRMCYELLRCCNSRLSTVRQESCSILYLLMRSNFEFTNRKGLNRVHLQVIISVSHMLGDAGGLNSVRFQESLSLINSYATSDKVMKGTGFAGEVKDLTRRIRTVLMATSQMREHHQDAEMLIDLQHSLANSYASTPELRHTWLHTMCRKHIIDNNFSEAMCCQLHVAALIAEYLKLKKVQTWGAEAFVDLSQNITKDETSLKLDSGVQQDVQYTEGTMLEQLSDCVGLMESAERWELLAPLYSLMIPMQLKQRNYHELARYHERLAHAYTRIHEANKSGKRLLGRYYRVAFFGQTYFEEESGNEYIYKEPKLTALAEVSDRLHTLYLSKFGRDTVKIIMDSKQVDASELDSKYAHIQVTSVTPYTSADVPSDRVTEFEVHHDVDTFMFETPFTKDGRVRANPQDQCKRRTVLFTEYKFPYVSKRIRVARREVTELSPIEVALDEMRQRVSELEEVVRSSPPDPKKLQLRLQGSVCVQVNAGPLAYAYAFLDPAVHNPYPTIHTDALKETFMDFVRICWSALQVNRTVIEADQREYQDVLVSNFHKLCAELSALLGESVCPEAEASASATSRLSQVHFSVISGASYSSSHA